MRWATGLMSTAVVSQPSRIASRGIAPPPAKQSRTLAPSGYSAVIRLRSDLTAGSSYGAEGRCVSDLIRDVISCRRASASNDPATIARAIASGRRRPPQMQGGDVAVVGALLPLGGGVDLGEWDLMLDRSTHVSLFLRGGDHGGSVDAVPYVEIRNPRPPQSRRWVSDAVEAGCVGGAVEHGVEPVVGAKFLGLGELSPGQFHGGDTRSGP